MAERVAITRYDEASGEVISKTDKPVYDKKHWPGYWWRMELATAALILDNEMTFTDVKVFLAIIELLKENNLAEVNQTRMARRLKTSRTAVCRSIAHLIGFGFVEKVEDGVYRVDVNLGWNGGEIERWNEKKVKTDRALKALR